MNSVEITSSFFYCNFIYLKIILDYFYMTLISSLTNFIKNLELIRTSKTSFLRINCCSKCVICLNKPNSVKCLLFYFNLIRILSLSKIQNFKVKYIDFYIVRCN